MDLGMSELLVIGIVALIVIGPKDLPEMFRQLGRMTAKMRAMAREFSRAMEQAAQETGVADVAKDLRAATDPKSMGLNAVKDAVDKFEKWDPIKNAAKPTQPIPPGGTLTSTPKEAGLTAAVPETAVSAMGPNTAALYQKKAAKEAIVKETTTRIKALDEVPVAAPDAKAKPAKPKAAPKPKTAPKSRTTETPAKATAPKAPRKKKAAEE